MGIVKTKSHSTEEEPTTQQRAIGLDTANLPLDIVSEDLSKWLKESAWHQPKWLTNRNNSGKLLDKNFEEYVMNTLRWRYVRLEGDFRTVFNNYYNTEYIDKVTARRIISFLESAREALENDNCDALDVSSLLDMADQYMVWLYPPHVANAQSAALAAQLKEQNNPWGIYLESEIGRSGQTLGGLRAALDKVKQVQNEENQIIQINSGLQIERLEMLIYWGKIVLIVMIIGLPWIMKSDAVIFKDTILQEMIGIKQWIGMLIIGIIGGVGAFLSGLLQVRRTRVTQGEFKESVIQFKLRPVVGAIFAMFIAALLSWDVISGIEIKNAGAFILIAFLCGFSERYFLNLLKIDDEGNSSAVPAAPVVASASSQAPPAKEDGDKPEPANVNDRKI